MFINAGSNSLTKALKKHHVALLIIVCIAIFPSFRFSSSIRIDYFIVVAVLGYALINRKGTWQRFDFAILCGFASLAIFITLALIFQFITDSSDPLSYVFNFMGFLRPTMYYIAASYLIIDYTKATVVLSYVRYLCIIVSTLIILEHLDLPIIEDAINIIYRGAVDTDNGQRAIGIFQRVHGAAYFSLFSLMFVISIFQINKELHLRKNRVVIILLLIAMLLTFSKSAILVFVVYILVAYKTKLLLNLKVLKILILSAGIFAIALYLDARLLHHVTILSFGIIYMMGFLDNLSVEKIGFVTGRVDHGWKNALEVWRESIWFGNVNSGEFVGDGGWTETLANHGILGAVGWILLFCFFFKSSLHSNLSKLHNRFTMANITFCLMLAMVPVGILMERISELMPFYLVILSRTLEARYRT